MKKNRKSGNWTIVESKKDAEGDTDFCAQFLKIVRAVYGEDFDFKTCTIERGLKLDVVSFLRDDSHEPDDRQQGGAGR